MPQRAELLDLRHRYGSFNNKYKQPRYCSPKTSSCNRAGVILCTRSFYLLSSLYEVVTFQVRPVLVLCSDHSIGRKQNCFLLYLSMLVARTCRLKLLQQLQKSKHRRE
jgi:hypothetical protein